MKFLFHPLLLLVFITPNLYAIEVIDDIGRLVELEKPAKRIVSLAPHITENLYASGAGDLIVGVVSYSDYPEEALDINEVGGYNNFNIELIISLQPDLIVAWKEGNQKQQVDRLIQLGLNVYITAPLEIEDIAKNMKDYGLLTANSTVANNASNLFLNRLQTLTERNRNLKSVSVFYQTWNHPLITVNDEQMIGKVINLCGGQNVFAELTSFTPQVSIEAVLGKNPQVIITSGHGESRPEWLDAWRKWPSLIAVQQNNLFFVPPNIIQRHTPRLLDGAEKICEQLQTVRAVE